MRTSPTTRWRRPLLSDKDSLPVAIALAAAAAGGAICLRLALMPVLPDDRGLYLVTTAAVLAVASLGGTRAGILCTLFCALAIDYIWLSPLRAVRIYKWPDFLVLGIFLLVGVTISALAGRLRRAKRVAETLAIDEARAHQVAQQNEERFRRLFEQGPLGTVLVGLDRRIRDANPMFCRIMGYSLDELCGCTVESLTHPDDVEKSATLFRQLSQGLIPSYSLVKRYVRKSGDPFWAILSVAALRDAGGRPADALGMVQDISEQKRMEADLEQAKEDAEAASRAKDHFMAVLSHELRTPLSPVLLTASSMEVDPSLPPPVRENLHLIRQNVELEARLIDDLLDLTGIARGKLVLHRMPVDAHALIGQALYTVQQTARDKRLSLQTHLDAPHTTLDGDPARLQQVFWNLLKNAVKFTPPGGTITIRTKNEGQGARGKGQAEDGLPSSLAPRPSPLAPSPTLTIEISDTGVGIPPDILPRLFRPFEQGPAAVTQQFGGLGLGLAICRSIVELHGGSIAAASPGPQQGSTFTVTLPLLPAHVAPEPSPVPVSPPPQLATRNSQLATPLNILLVEDHPATRRAMSSILQSLGHRVRPAATLADALSLAAAEPFDLVISDLALPDGSGHDLMRQLKSHPHPPHGVAVSGYGMPDDIRRSREAGFDEHLTKPISRDKIREVLTHVGA